MHSIDYSVPDMKGDGVKVKRNAHSSDLVYNLQNFVQQLQKFTEGVPNHCDTGVCFTAPDLLLLVK